MNGAREHFGGLYLRGKLYAIAPGDPFEDGALFEVLDLDDLPSGWKLHRAPPNFFEKNYSYIFINNIKATAVDNRYIYAAAATYTKPPESKIYLFSHDTESGTWDNGLKHPKFNRSGEFNLTSITIPNEGTYVVLLGGYGKGFQRVCAVEAYHVESKEWIQLPDLPGVSSAYNPDRIYKDRFRDVTSLTSLGSRYILVAAEGILSWHSTNVIAFDWKQREWFSLPSRWEERNDGAGAIVGGTINKWIITGGYGEDGSMLGSISLDIGPGIGWATERLLLLCFQNKAQKDKCKAKGPCLLEGLDAGVFANILLYLFVPFQNEIECKGSIFAGRLKDASPPSSGKRRGMVESTSQPSNKIRKCSY